MRHFISSFLLSLAVGCVPVAQPQIQTTPPAAATPAAATEAPAAAEPASEPAPEPAAKETAAAEVTEEPAVEETAEAAPATEVAAPSSATADRRRRVRVVPAAHPTRAELRGRPVRGQVRAPIKDCVKRPGHPRSCRQ